MDRPINTGVAVPMNANGNIACHRFSPGTRAFKSPDSSSWPDPVGELDPKVRSILPVEYVSVKLDLVGLDLAAMPAIRLLVTGGDWH